MKTKLIALLLATSSFSALAVEPSALRPAAPDQHVVTKGDTLWGISGMYLKQPWRWPELWGANKNQVKNPHRIYPGQILVLDRASGTLSIRHGASFSGTEVLQPRAHLMENTYQIPAIAWNVLEPFVSKSIILDEKILGNAPRVVGGENDRIALGQGDKMFVKGIHSYDTPKWNIFRKGVPLKNANGELVGYDSSFVGTAILANLGEDVSVLTIQNSKEEVSRGDFLVPVDPPQIAQFHPTPAPQHLQANILKIVANGLSETSRTGAILLDVGASHGVEPGHVFHLHRQYKAKIHDDDSTRSTIEDMPSQKVGTAMVYKVQDNVAFAMVMESTGVIPKNSIAIAP